MSFNPKQTLLLPTHKGIDSFCKIAGCYSLIRIKRGTCRTGGSAHKPVEGVGKFTRRNSTVTVTCVRYGKAVKKQQSDEGSVVQSYGLHSHIIRDLGGNIRGSPGVCW